ncbi:MAG TPA: hypothetical protein VFV96_11735 [Verrucomicrobiae bacterium]|nr:hypothetical protein [Verrucomicrobiae bacterium]
MEILAVTVVLLVAGVALLVLWLGVSWGWWPSPRWATVVRIREGKVVVVLGQLRATTREDVAEVLASSGIRRGFITLSTAGEVRFFRTIPPGLHQRLRNVLLN